MEHGLLLCGLLLRRSPRSLCCELCKFRSEIILQSPETIRTADILGLPVGCGPQGMGGGTNILYRNRGDGTFEDVSRESGIAVPCSSDRFFVSDRWIPTGSYGLGVSAADFDNDGWPEHSRGLRLVSSRFYHNKGDVLFQEVGREIGCAVNENGGMQAGMGIAVGDYDCDGWLDIVKTNVSGSDGETVSQQRGWNFLPCRFLSLEATPNSWDGCRTVRLRQRWLA